MPKPAQSDDTLVIPAGVIIDDSHCMGYEPCLVYECSKCGLSVKHNADELKQWCTEDLT